MRRSTSIGLAAAVVVLAIAAFLIGRSTAPAAAITTAATTTATTTVTLTPSVSPSTATVTCTPEAATPTEDPDAAPAAAVPTMVEPGVVVGYPQTQEGAIAAAGNFTDAILAPGRLSPTDLDATLAVIAASPEAAQQIRTPLLGEWAQAAGLLSVSSLNDPSVIAYGRALGYRVLSVDDSAASIAVHVTGGQGNVTGTSALNGPYFQVDQVDLIWTGGDWKLDNITRAVSSGPRLDTADAESYQPFPAGPVAEG